MSTISTAERREAARRLRELGKFVYIADNTYELMADALGVDDFEARTFSFDRLADLIEPEPERTCRMTDNGCELCCSLCDTRHGYDDEPNYCRGCGAKVVDDARP